MKLENNNFKAGFLLLFDERINYQNRLKLENEIQILAFSDHVQFMGCTLFAFTYIFSFKKSWNFPLRLE